MLVGLAPLLVIGVVTMIVLGVKFATARSSINEASETTTGEAVDASGDDLTVQWTDRDGDEHTSVVTFDGLGPVDDGADVILHYEPDDTGNLYVRNDARWNRAEDLFIGLLLVGTILVIAVATTAVRFERRRRAERRPAGKQRFSVAHSRWGLVTRTWLVSEQDKREWWQPVYWDPALDTVDPKKSYEVHGAPQAHPLQVVTVDDAPIWPAGRRRLKVPRGEIRRMPGPVDRSDEGMSLRRHLRGDMALVLAAPFLALLWAYVDQGGAGSFWASLAVMAGVLFWVASVYGSDPT